MTKEFVPYTLALKLKKLGFDEPCLAYYDEQGKHYPMGTVVGPNTIHFGTFLPSIQKGASALLTGSPLYQQAFRWFREKYGLFVSPNVISYEDGPYLWFFEINSTVLPFGTDLGETDDYKTYEEAELACLDKLIELVESELK